MCHAPNPIGQADEGESLETKAPQHASVGRLDAAAVESAASVLGVGPPDVSGRLPLNGTGDDRVEPGLDDAEPEEPTVAPKMDGFTVCELAYENRGKATQLNIVMKPAAVRDGFRSRKCGVVCGSVPGKELHEFVAQHWEHYVVASTGEKSSIALILNPGNKRVKMMKDMTQGIVSDDVVGELRKVLKATGEIWTTVRATDVAKKSKVTREDIISTMRGYLTLNPVEFRAEIWALKLKHACELSKGEALIVANPTMAQQLRQDLINLEGAKCFVKFLSETKVLDIENAINLPLVLRLTVQDDGKLVRESMPYLAALALFMEEKTFICCGDSDLGKTALARASCKLYCEANGTPYYIETNTPDSLRQVSVNGFFRQHVPVILDEWKPEGNKYTGKDGIDMLKCLCTVDDEGATIKCRYSDIKFAAQMPKFMTCNCTLDEWIAGLGEVTQADLKAVLKRCLFTETTATVIPHELRKEFVGKRRNDCGSKLRGAMAQRGMRAPNFLEARWTPVPRPEPQ